MSSIFKLPEVINFWKVRGSYATVGLGLPTNITNAMVEYSKGYVYGVDAGTIVYPKSSFATGAGFEALLPKPELNKTFEAGTELRMLGNKLNFDITYYNSNTSNQLLETTIPSYLGGLAPDHTTSTQEKSEIQVLNLHYPTRFLIRQNSDGRPL